jgi:tetratricopeptide (TPR) repeat protein
MKRLEKAFETFAKKRARELAPQADWEQPEKDPLDPTNREALTNWLTKHPNNFQALTLYAKNLIADRQWEKAIEILDKLIELYPQYTGDDNAYQLLAEVHRHLGETDREQQVLDKLATMSTDAIHVYGRLLEIAMEKESWQDVVRYGRKYMAVYPLLTKLYWQLGRAGEALGHNEEAVESYRRLLLLEPADPVDINYRLGRLLQHSNPSEAKRHVLMALAEAPRFREAHRLLLTIVNDSRKSSDSISNEDNEDTQ